VCEGHIEERELWSSAVKLDANDGARGQTVALEALLPGMAPALALGRP
jgi:hypothetical protein